MAVNLSLIFILYRCRRYSSYDLILTKEKEGPGGFRQKKLQTEGSITFENPSLETGFKQKEKSTIICIQIKSMILLMRAL